MAWQPDEAQLKQLVGYLKDALSGQDQNAQRQATLVSLSVIHGTSIEKALLSHVHI